MCVFVCLCVCVCVCVCVFSMCTLFFFRELRLIVARSLAEIGLDWTDPEQDIFLRRLREDESRLVRCEIAYQCGKSHRLRNSEKIIKGLLQCKAER